MLEKLFGNPVIEKVLFYIMINKQGYGSRMAKEMNLALYSVQKAIARLEDGGIIAAQTQGKTRLYQFNPRYPLLEELKTFLKKAYTFLPQAIKEKLYETPIRRRPRASGKNLKVVADD